jgi:hypothetical protein
MELLGTTASSEAKQLLSFGWRQINCSPESAPDVSSAEEGVRVFVRCLTPSSKFVIQGFGSMIRLSAFAAYPVYISQGRGLLQMNRGHLLLPFHKII